MQALTRLWSVCQGTANASAEESAQRIVTAANAVTAVGIGALAFYLPALYAGAAIGATILAATAVLSDVLDGAVARHTGGFSHIGKCLDWLRDALLRTVLLVGTLLMSADTLVPWLIVPALMAESAMFGAEAYCALRGQRMIRDYSERLCLGKYRAELHGHTVVVVRQTIMGVLLIALPLVGATPWLIVATTVLVTVNATLFALELLRKK